MGLEEINERLVDIIIASIALLLLSPIFLLVAYRVRKNLGSPYLFLPRASRKRL